MFGFGPPLRKPALPKLQSSACKPQGWGHKIAFVHTEVERSCLWLEGGTGPASACKVVGPEFGRALLWYHSGMSGEKARASLMGAAGREGRMPHWHILPSLEPVSLLEEGSAVRRIW